MALEWKLDKHRPICPQICEQLCARIAAGEFAPGQRLMSVRDVAVAAGVNPNTVQRAFEQLENQGVLHSERGAGWFVGSIPDAAEDLRQAMAQEKLSAFFGEMAGLGLTPEDIKKLVKEWEV